MAPSVEAVAPGGEVDIEASAGRGTRPGREGRKGLWVGGGELQMAPRERRGEGEGWGVGHMGAVFWETPLLVRFEGNPNGRRQPGGSLCWLLLLLKRPNHFWVS